LRTLTNGHAQSHAAGEPPIEPATGAGEPAPGDSVPDVPMTADAQPVSGGGSGGGSAAYYMAMPQLMGAPAYARPPRIVMESPRPLDPDDLPIAAMRSPEDEMLLSGVYQQPVDVSEPTLQPSSQGGLRGIASRLFGSGS
jgi:hypothetical protein